MRLHSGLAAATGTLLRGCIAVGNFDGVHRGHQALFQLARGLASARGGPCAALTFEPHPAKLLAPQFAPALICSPLRKRELLAAQGLDALVVQPFDAAFARTAPERFIELLAGLGVSEVVVGYDFTYGAHRRGTVDTLRAGLRELGVALHVVPPFAVDDMVASSTKVREFALQGIVGACATLLGRPLDLEGEVVRGAGRGRQLGWPTANIRTAGSSSCAVGVYAVRVRLIDGPLPRESELDAAPLPLRTGSPLPGAANLGLNPTFRQEGGAQAAGQSHAPLLLEVHLLDFSGDLYGHALRVEWIHRLREERRFPGPDALRAQIARDVGEARRLLAS
ncbi:MAG: bifunctional riboflavin kinase/FAD synthetase [Myxococcales bacterium]